MTDAPVFVAIGIACVVAVLLFIVFIIYCVKKHQDKEQARRTRQRRIREERQRRHFMGGNIVHPPPYDPNRESMIPSNESEIPVSPPPAYKEVATPLPVNRNAHDVDDSQYTLPFHDYLSESDNLQPISRNVAPVNTVLRENYYESHGSSVPNGMTYNESRSINRTTITTPISPYINDDNFQIQPSSSDLTITDTMRISSNYLPAREGYSHARTHEETYSKTSSRNNRQLHSHVFSRQRLDATRLLEEQNNDTRLLINTASSNNRSERNLYDSSNRSERSLYPSSNQNEVTNQLFNPTNPRDTKHKLSNSQRTGLTDVTNLDGHHRDGSNMPTNYILFAGESGTSSALMPAKVLDERIIEVAPALNPSNSHSLQWRTNQSEQRQDECSGLEELSLI